MQSSFRVQVSKDYLVFASAHFITFRGHQCESLHGHNYRVGVMVEGDVDAECLFVLDFSVLKRIVRELAGRSGPAWSGIEDRAHRALEASLGRALTVIRGPAGLDLAAGLA